MSQASNFISRYDIDYRSIRLEEQIGVYLEEMERGLRGEPSSLLMLPSYIQLKDDMQKNKKVVCVDAGGTNLRITTAYFDNSGTLVMGNIDRHIMPGVEKMLSAQEFFDILAELIAPFCVETKDIVMSFAYPSKTTPNIDAIPIFLTKEVKVSDISGKAVAREITEALAKKGVAGASMIVTNDTVVSALSGRAEYAAKGYGAFTGTILGTGSNSCYPELCANIKKLPELSGKGVMIVNAEAGSYDKMPRSIIDINYDASTQCPGTGIAEKMTSGAYLGALCKFMLRQAAEDNVFRTRGVEEIQQLTTMDVSEYLSNGSGIIEEYMLNEEDEANAKELLQNIVFRAARLAAVQMAAMAVKSHKQNNRICMSIEGTTYEKMPGLKQELHSCLLEYLGSKGIDATITTIEHAVLKGCAIAGLARQ